jgi:hypothetical protein
MEPDDNSCIRVILRPDQGHTVLDAQSSCGGYPFPLSRVNLSRTTPEQHRPSQSGVERFGPNQVVGVPAFGDPLEHLSVNRVFLPETLHSCLALPYILHSSLSIGCLRVLSLPGTFSHKSSAAGGRNIVFATGGRNSNITEERNAYGRSLFNRAPYSQRPIQDHHIQQQDKQDAQQT